MKTIAILLAFISIPVTIILFVNQSNYVKNEVEASANKTPRLITLSDTRLGKESIGSLVLLDDKTLLAAMDPKPDIAKFEIASDGKLRSVERYERQAWRITNFNFIDDKYGFAIGNYGTLLKTMDAAATWIEMPAISEYDLTQIDFLDEKIGYVAGRMGSRNKESGNNEWTISIWKTGDGGITWKQSYSEKDQSDVLQIKVLSSNVALALIGGQGLIRTEDSGATWASVFDSDVRVSSFSFGSNSKGFLMLGNGGSVTSIDQGKTWQADEKLSKQLGNVPWRSVSFGQTGNGLAVSEDGLISYTYDNGTTWKRMPEVLPDTLRSATIDRSVGLIVGSRNIYKVEF